MLTSDEVVFLLDVDNTLLDNDRFVADLSARLKHDFGETEHRRYWSIYRTLRERLGYADYLGALQQFREGSDNSPALLRMSAFLLDYPFAERLYPRAMAVIEHLRTMGKTVILSDGDIVFQPRKIQRAGLWDAVDACVLIYLHKEQQVDAVQGLFSARHYVMMDDKLQLLGAMKRVLRNRLTTVFVRQGHYAAEQMRGSTGPSPDVIVDRIGDLCEFAMDRFRISPATGDQEVP